MSETDADLPALLSELTRSLETLQDELEPSDRRARPPTPRELARFTSEVTIPAIVLVLETNIRALRLVQRALRFADGRDVRPSDDGPRTRQRAVELGRATLSRLDETLTDLGEALEGRPPDDEARELLTRIRDIEDDIEAQLEATGAEAEPGPDGVEVDVDAELASLKDDVSDDDVNEGDDDNV
ncbi:MULTISPECIES: DUF7547 family protein [Salinibaculum]|uniref:DUF7547 family protein n=1 Tax=Salinibaculum TaxID=2732368 RepID=UPI0030CF2947